MGSSTRASLHGRRLSGALADDAQREVADIALRPPAAADLEAIAAIESECFADPWSVNEFASVIKVDHSIFLVAETKHGEILGYVVAISVLDEGEILNIAVRPSLRGKGFGGLLLDAALIEVEKRGAVTVFLEVRVSNTAARALYASREFEEISKRKNYYRTPVEDALVMRRAVKR